MGALERLLGKLALENEFLKGFRGNLASRQATSSVIAGLVVSQSRKNAGRAEPFHSRGWLRLETRGAP